MSSSEEPIGSAELNCGSGGGADSHFNLRVAAIFVILVGSSTGALFPVVARRTRFINVPSGVFDFAKYFGSGVIIATAFIHLLAPGLEALGSECLAPGWHEYPYALALALFSIFFIFIVEITAFRVGTAKLAKIGLNHDAHGHGVGGHAAHGPEGAAESGTATPIEYVDEQMPTEITEKKTGHGHHHHARGPRFDDSLVAQIVGVFILEFGVLLHSFLIGLTLAVDEDFKTLFVVLLFHQTFEGLGIGARLAYLKLADRYNYVPFLAAAVYGLSTPLGIAVGLGVRTTYNPGSTTASIVSGVMDSLSAGILIYTGLVELLAHEFLFNKEMINGSTGKIAYAIGSMCLGCAIMALLGRWA